MALTRIQTDGITDGSILNADINASAAIALSKLSTSGTASGSTYLRGDGAWSTVPSADPSVGIDFNDNVKARWGTGNDLEIYHSGSHSYIKDTGTGSLVLNSNSFYLNNAGDSETLVKATEDGAVELYYDNSKKLETTSSGITVTSTGTSKIEGTSNANLLSLRNTTGGNGTVGMLFSTNATAGREKAGIFHVETSGSAHYEGDILICCDHNSGDAGQVTTAEERLRIKHSGEVKINDNGKFIAGTGDDLQIYHDGTNSQIHNATGILKIRGDIVRIKNAADSAYTATFNAGGNSNLYYDGSKKLETTSDGAKLSGKLSFDSSVSGEAINLADNQKIYLGSGDDLQIYHDGSNSILNDNGTGHLQFQVGGTTKAAIVADGVQLYEHLYVQDSDKIKIGNGSDLQIYHDGSNSYIDNDTGSLINDIEGTFQVKATDVYLYVNNTEHGIRCFGNGGTELYYDNSKKLGTASWGTQIYGNLQLDDSNIAKFGNSGDLQIYHDGSNSYITNDTAGLFIQGGTQNNSIYIRPRDGENSIQANSNSSVDLYFDNAKKLETKSNGVRVSSSADTELEVKSTGQDGAPSILFVSDNADDNADNWRLRADGGGTAFSIQNYAGGSWESNIVSKENAQVELYYDNSKKFETKSYGANMPDNSQLYFGTGDDLVIKHDGTDSRIINAGSDLYLYTTGDHDVKILADSQNAVICKPDAAVELYYDNVKTFNTASSGIEIRGPESGNCELYMYADEGDDNADLWKFVADVNGGFSVQNKTSGSWENNITAIGNGATDLWYDNSKKLETTSDGIQVVNTVAGESKALTIRNPDTGGSSAVSMVFDMDRSTGGINFEAGKIKCVKETTWTTTPSTVDSSMEFYTIKDETSTHRMTINSDGHFLVGTSALTTTSTDPGFAVDPDGAIVLRRNGTMVMLKSIGTGGYTAISILSANTEVGSCTFNSGGTSWNTSSDYRLKENQVSISDGITRLKTLKPYRFNFKTNPSETVDGFFAHEVSPAVPEAITGTKDAVATADDAAEHDHLSVGDPIYQQIDQSKLVPLLTAALQEEIKLRENLEARVAALGG